ncbi:uncharacterized protein LOC120634104 [Pararge aegeria]|uniref:uncharacterized protein LOC120634104 n=1 Tax=Pararge aegeria TaxID=116150 RepID=UPI0019D2F5A0|nr:uncharacterized protein LOC120634104 [Pararge aegeria]
MWTLTELILITLSGLANSQLDYTVNFDSPIYVCPDEDSQGYVDASQVQVKRHNETATIMTGVIKFLKGFEKDTMIEFIAEKDTGGSYEMVVSHEICDVCGELQNPESAYAGYLPYFGFPDLCPFEPNNYIIKDLVADSQDVPLNSAMAGRYQVTLNMYKNTDGQCLDDKIFIACLKLDFLVEAI